ncbi:uncharacterized protein LTR77_010134 [Saxophila tyrrhenica]|uniref:Uncharacterized protein n=1 Tax=Saxophila tyrrhenica TaxID=1690608 RepID=A0AAV9NZU0_9PEZI|nr:hypothetical protein LTR77_010134 [Saxophila tyrrhenica]
MEEWNTAILQSGAMGAFLALGPQSILSRARYLRYTDRRIPKAAFGALTIEQQLTHSTPTHRASFLTRRHSRELTAAMQQHAMFSLLVVAATIAGSRAQDFPTVVTSVVPFPTTSTIPPAPPVTFGSGLDCNLQLGGQVVNGQCVRIFSDHQVGAIENPTAAFKPNVCDGTCYPYPPGFGAIHVTGDGTFGTDCHVFSTTTCDQGSELFDNGNTKQFKAASFDPSQTGRSVQCFFKC